MSRRNLLVWVLLGTFLLVQCGKKETEALRPDGKRTQKIAVTFVLGKAIIKSEKSSQWEAITVGRLIQLADEIKVDKRGRVVMQSESGSVITVKDAADLKISSLFNPKDGEEETLISLNSGKTVINPRELTGKSSFDVKTPAMVAGVRGTVFTVEHSSGKSRVMVKEGKVAVRPQLQNEELSQALKPVDVNVGQQTELSLENVQQIEKSIATSEEQKGQVSDQAAAEMVQQAVEKELKEVLSVQEMKTAEKVEMEQDAKELLKLEINLKDKEITSGSQGQKQSVYGAVSVSSYGSEIFINGVKSADDYFSSLYLEGEDLNIEVKQGDQVILQKNVKVTRDGVTLDLTPQDVKTKEMDKIQEGVTQEPYKILAEGYKIAADSMQKGEGFLAFQSQNTIRLGSLENPSQLKTLTNNPRVRPLLAGGVIFTSDMQGNLIVWDLSGNRKGQVSLEQAIDIPSSIAYNDGRAFLANSFGKIVGIDTAGNSVLNMQIPGEILSGSPMAVSKDKVVAFSPVSFNAYVIGGGKVESQFKLNSRILHRPAIISGKLVLPEGNQITVRELSGQVLASIQTASADIYPISGQVFAVLYADKTVLYNLKGQLLNQLPTTVALALEGKLVYAVGQTVFVSEGSRTQNVVLPEKVQALALEKGRVVALSQSGKVYQLDI